MYTETKEKAADYYRHSLHQIAGALTDLESLGTGWYRGICPLCGGGKFGEPDFTVFPNGSIGEQTFKCDECGESGDVSDFLRLRYSLAPAPGHTQTDLGNSERFVARHGGDLRYCHAWRKWLVWDGTRWLPDDRGAVREKAKETVRSIYDEAGKQDEAGVRKALAGHAKRSESRQRVEAMVSLAESSLPVRAEELDAAPWLLNYANGTLDLRTGELLAHDRERLITKLVPVEYDPDAEAPVFEAFLKRILPSEALRGFLQRVVGYAASGVVSEEMLPILHGAGANGKSTLVNAIMEALGDYAMQAPPELLMAKQGTHPTELADLFRARFVASVETDDGRRLAEGLVKQLTGRDRIKARRMREDFWEFDPTHTVFLATNHRPEVRGTDHAIWRRLKLVPFEITIPEAEQDKKLPEKLRKELPGILAWIVRGCREYQSDGLGEPEEVKEATRGYRSDMDVLAAFIEARCVRHPDAIVGATPLYNVYKDWCAEAGESQLTQTKFGRRLSERGFEREKDGVVFWHGIGLRDDRPDPDPAPDRGDKGPGEGANRPDLDGSLANHPNAESRIGKRNGGDAAETVGRFGPRSGINALINAREEINPEKGPNPPNRPKLSEEAAGGEGLSAPLPEPGNAHRIRGVFRSLHYHRGVGMALGYYHEERTEASFEQLCRSALFAARIDTERWEEYTDVVLAEVAKRPRPPVAEDPEEGMVF